MAKKKQLKTPRSVGMTQELSERMDKLMVKEKRNFSDLSCIIFDKYLTENKL